MDLRITRTSWAAVGIAAAVSGISSAATVTNINSTIVNAGTCQLQTTGCPESYSIVTQGTSTIGISGASPSSFGFTDSFNQGAGTTNVTTGSNFGASATGPGPTPWNFQDNILFTTSASLVQAQASATLNGVSDLQVRIVSATSQQGTALNLYNSTNANAAMLLGNAAAGLVTVVDGWQNFSNPIAGVDFTGTLPTAVGPGTYVLQIRGEAAAGSSYSGTATFTPVPLPAALWLMLSGIGALLRFGRRRTAAV